VYQIEQQKVIRAGSRLLTLGQQMGVAYPWGLSVGALVTKHRPFAIIRHPENPRGAETVRPGPKTEARRTGQADRPDDCDSRLRGAGTASGINRTNHPLWSAFKSPLLVARGPRYD